MKTFFSFFKHNKLLCLILVLVMTASSFIAITTIAAKEYYNYSLSFYQGDEFKNSVLIKTYSCFCSNFRYEYNDLFNSDREKYYQKENEESIKFANENIGKKSKEFSAVKNVYQFSPEYANYNDNLIQVQFASEETYKTFNYPLSEGNWFSECEQTSKYPNAVLSGNLYKDVSVGSDINVEIINVAGKNVNITVHVIGKVAPPYYALNITFPAPPPDYNYITNYPMVFLPDNDFTRNAIAEKTSDNYITYLSNFLVTFKENATQNEIDEYLQFISKYSDKSGNLETYVDFYNTITKLKTDCDNYVTPYFVISIISIIISLLALIFISSFIVKRNIEKNAIYRQFNAKKVLLCYRVIFFPCISYQQY